MVLLSHLPPFGSAAFLLLLGEVLFSSPLLPLWGCCHPPPPPLAGAVSPLALVHRCCFPSFAFRLALLLRFLLGVAFLFRFVCFPMLFSCVWSFSCHLSFSFSCSVLFFSCLPGFHFIFIFHFMFSSCEKSYYYFHVSFHFYFQFLSGTGGGRWKHARRIYPKSRALVVPAIHANCHHQRDDVELEIFLHCLSHMNWCSRQTAESLTALGKAQLLLVLVHVHVHVHVVQLARRILLRLCRLFSHNCLPLFLRTSSTAHRTLGPLQ